MKKREFDAKVAQVLFGWVVSQFPMVVASNLYGTLKFSKKYQHKGCQTRKTRLG